jgi:hypothetical protein
VQVQLGIKRDQGRDRSDSSGIQGVQGASSMIRDNRRAGASFVACERLPPYWLSLPLAYRRRRSCPGE